MTNTNRYTFQAIDSDYAEDDPRRWQSVCAPRICDSDAQAEAHVRWMALGKTVRVHRPGATWAVYSPAGA
jgi:hypothetical protein